MSKEEKAFEYFRNSISDLQKDYFDPSTNDIFEYSLKSLWKTHYHQNIKKIILNFIKHNYQIFNEDPTPPVIYILFSLNDKEINTIIQNIVIKQFIQEQASEASTFTVLNIVDILADKTNIDDFVNDIIDAINHNMNEDMISALSFFIINKNDKYIKQFISKFKDLKKIDLIKELYKMFGRKIMLSLIESNDFNIIKKLNE